jgi:hypothetical protein
MKRKKAVQEAVQRKINADKMRLFNNKCINSKNKAKGFWEMLRDNKANVTPSQISSIIDIIFPCFPYRIYIITYV